MKTNKVNADDPAQNVEKVENVENAMQQEGKKDSLFYLYFIIY